MIKGKIERYEYKKLKKKNYNKLNILEIEIGNIQEEKEESMKRKNERKKENIRGNKETKKVLKKK